MATFVKFQPFVENLAEGKFNFSSDATCTITVALSATAPTNTWGTLSQVSQVSYANLSGREVEVTSSGQSGGVYKLILKDLVLTASGDVATFRYIVLYDDAAASDELICYFDKGEDVTLHNGDTLTLDFDGTNGILQIT